MEDRHWHLENANGHEARENRCCSLLVPEKESTREVIRKLTETTIGDATGYAEIIKALDHVYLADATTRTLTAFKEFYEFSREGGMDFSKFIVEYESRFESDLE